MRDRDFDAYVEAAARFLVEEHNFVLSQRVCTRSDALMRSVRFDLLSVTPTSYRFDIHFDLGIPGVTEFGTKKQLWIVRAYAQLASREEPSYPKPKLILIKGEAVEPAAHRFDELIKRLTEDFLLRYSDPDLLYQMVRNSALEFTRRGMSVHDEFRRLHLEPWNVIVRLELAAVYAAFLGREADVNRILRLANEYAPKYRVEHAIPRLEANVEAARRKQGASR
jgi:hypothetical protein